MRFDRQPTIRGEVLKLRPLCPENLRLLEARRLLMTDAGNVETAAWQVGYESPSQFNREYARMFGAPPKRDILGLRARAAAGGHPTQPTRF